jgi:hypothetical protein
MDVSDWILLLVAAVACAFGVMQLRRANTAVLDVSDAKKKAESELRSERNRLLAEAEQ